MATKSKEVVEKEENLPAVVSFEEDAGQGFENADRDAYAIPFLNIIQKMSPQVDPDSGSYREDAKPGDFMDTVTGELFSGSDGVVVIPVYYTRTFIEWVPREEGGGFVGEHQAGAPEIRETQRNEKNQDVLPNGNLLTDTRNHYCLLVRADGTYCPVVVTMTSTQLKKSRRWMTMMDSIKLKGKNGLFTPPSYSHMYRLTTITESNDKGTWKGFDITNIGQVDNPELYQAAKGFYNAIKGGAVQKQSADHMGDDFTPASDATVVSDDDF